MTKIKFLATGDLHSDKKFVKSIAKNTDLNSIDFIILIGDISEKNNDYKDLLDIFKKKQIFMIPGNHESKSKIQILEEHYNVHLIGNSPVKINENLALFGSNYLHIGPFGIPEEEVFENLIQNHEAIKDSKFKIHLAHIPPAKTKIGDMSPFAPFIEGSHAQRLFLEKFNPDVSLVGHIHESSGLEEIVNKTKVINVGKTFKIFEFDTKSNKLKILK